MIKILFTIPNFDTAGSGKALLNVARSLDDSKFEPHICCSHSKGDYYKTVQASGIPIHIKQTTHPMIPRLKGIKDSIMLAKFFRELNIDIIHSFHYLDDYSEALAAKIAKVPWIYTKKNMNWGSNSWYLRTLLSKHILAQNTEMLKRFFPRNNKVSLVPRGVDTKEFYPSKPKRKVLKKFNIHTNDIVLICVANLHPVKGVETLIDAFLQLPKNLGPIHLLIVGFKDNQYGKSLEKKVYYSDPEYKIHFTGKVNNVKDYLSISNLFILPTLNLKRKEGCPVALLEALASGLNVLGSDVCGINDVLKNFPDNLFEPGNILDLKKKIEIQLINLNKHEKNHLREHAIENYDILVEVKKHEEVYLKVLGKKD